MAKDPGFKKQEEDRGKAFSDYWPLISLILIAAAAGVALTYHTAGGMFDWMHYFMGFFLCSFAMLKLFHPGPFADGFEMYDLLAKRCRFYGYVYPFLELGLGLSYLAFFQLQMTYILTIIIMLFGSIGVISALRRGLDINCPCMGSVLNVPLSTITLTEDIAMAVMATLMLTMSMS